MRGHLSALRGCGRKLQVPISQEGNTPLNRVTHITVGFVYSLMVTPFYPPYKHPLCREKNCVHLCVTNTITKHSSALQTPRYR